MYSSNKYIYCYKYVHAGIMKYFIFKG